MIVSGISSINRSLSILAHHDDWGSTGRLEGGHQIQKNKRIGIPALPLAAGIDDDPENQDSRLNDDEAPGAHHGRNPIRNRFTPGKPITWRIEPRLSTPQPLKQKIFFRGDFFLIGFVAVAMLLPGNQVNAI
nr:hypothetical protein [Synechococcus sp. RedBA-s]